MSKVLYWILKIISILLLVIPIVLCLPGLIFHVLSEELEDRVEKKILRQKLSEEDEE
jgi:hypothetical protein